MLAAALLPSAEAAVPAAGQTRITAASLIDRGVAPANAVQTFALSLPLRNVGALNAFIASTVDPTSRTYRQFLTPAQFTAAYGPTADSVAQVTAFLAANGIAVGSVSSNRVLVTASATNAQLSSLFGTAIHTYTLGAQTFQRPVGTVTMPQGLQGLASSVTGLSNQPLSHSYLKQVPRSGALAGEPDAAPQALTPSVVVTNSPGQLTTGDVLKIYNGLPLATRGLTGAGTTVGIMTFAGFDQADAYAYWNLINQPVLANRITEIGVAGHVATPADSGADETTLDVEQSGGLSPQAKIVVYEADNTSLGSLQLYNQAVSENLCDTISISWGLAEVFEDPVKDLPAYDAILMQAAAQGTPIMASSGDSGAYDINRSTYTYPTFTPILTVDFPASHPLILAAGGTTLPTTVHRKYGPVIVPAERPWGWDYFRDYYVKNYGQAVYYTSAFPVGGGGGVSVQYGVPSYQAGLPGLKTSSVGQSMFGPSIYDPVSQTFSGPIIDYIDVPGRVAGRNVPDVSLNADPSTGYYLVFGNALYSQGGGTSFVAPQLNGIFSLITQQAGRRLGLLHPQLYGAYRALGYGTGSPFRALTTGTNLYYTATNSFNPAVGLGVLNIDNLSQALAPAPK
jgi:kumamolisin